MRAGVIANLVLLLVGATLAYRAFTAADAPAEEEAFAPLIDVALEAVVEVRYTSEDGALTLRRTSPSDFGATLVREVPEKPEGKNASTKKADAPDAGPVEEAPVPTATKTFRFPVASRVVRSLDKLTPLKVRRKLEDVSADRLAAMGLDDKAAKFALRTAEAEVALTVGEKTYGGAARYVRGPDGAVYLVDATAFSGLEGNEMRLSERRLVSTSISEVTKASFAIGDKTAGFEHQNRDDAKERFFARPDAPEEPFSAALDAVTFLRRQRVTRFVDPDTVPAEARAVRAVFQLSLVEGRPIEGRLLGQAGDEAYVELPPFIGVLSVEDADEALAKIKECLP